MILSNDKKGHLMQTVFIQGCSTELTELLSSKIIKFNGTKDSVWASSPSGYSFVSFVPSDKGKKELSSGVLFPKSASTKNFGLNLSDVSS